jgi:preprotein translocase subunit SecF
MTTDTLVATSGVRRLLRGQTAVDFAGKKWWGLGAAVVVVVITVVSLFAQGLNLGLDFEGGNAWEVPASESFGVAEAEQVLADNDVSTANARIQERSSETVDVITVEIEEVPADQATAITQDFAEAADVPVDDISFAFTSSRWGGEITEKAVRALVVFLLIVTVYISLRFEWRMAAAAIVAMLHDVVLAVGIYSLFQFLVTPETVVAFLTILGYSLYDSVVVFDRIKENEAKYAGVRMPYDDIVNISMNQVLMRSLNTSISSILPVISLLVVGTWIMGAVALRDFAVALLVGMAAGVYSSIFIATPVVALLNASPERSTHRRRLTGEALRAAVVGGSVTGRALEADAERTARGRGRAGAAADVVDDAAEGTTTPSSPTSTAGPPSADRLLSHAPRPRKKKRH